MSKALTVSKFVVCDLVLSEMVLQYDFINFFDCLWA